MKLAINIALSLLVLAVCTWLVWPSPEARAGMAAALGDMDVVYVVACLALMPVVHFCRAWRWNNLLAPIGAQQPPGRLLAVSSVGFMAILALPARLGEFVRPALIRKKGEISASAALGTIAVERISDGLFVSLFVFVTFFHLHGPDSPWWMIPSAVLALGLFSSALLFLAFALRWPEQTVNFAVTLTLLRRFAPRVADVLREKLANMISGFTVLKDRRNLVVFVLWTAVYWTVNTLVAWVLSLGFAGLDVPLVGTFAMVGLIAVGIMVPNSPGLMGQYQALAIAGLGLSVGSVANSGVGHAYTNVLYGVQLVWYLGIGGLALATPYVSIREVRESRHMKDDKLRYDEEVP